MLKAIQRFFDKNICSDQHTAAQIDRHRLQLATAALLIEVMRSDYQFKEIEQQAVMRAIQTKFGLSPGDTAELTRLAEGEAQHATDYHQFTALINKGFSAAQKEQLIEYMWQVAYADGDLNKYEEHLVRKIAELLHVPHAAYIAAKHRAYEAQQTASD